MQIDGYYVSFYCTNKRAKAALLRKTSKGRSFYVIGVVSRQHNRDVKKLFELLRSSKIPAPK